MTTYQPNWFFLMFKMKWLPRVHNTHQSEAVQNINSSEWNPSRDLFIIWLLTFKHIFGSISTLFLSIALILIEISVDFEPLHNWWSTRDRVFFFFLGQPHTEFSLPIKPHLVVQFTCSLGFNYPYTLHKVIYLFFLF